MWYHVMGIALEDIQFGGFMCIQITIFYNKTKTTDEITLELLNIILLNVILPTSNKTPLAIKYL